jgi:hypothetical protein
VLWVIGGPASHVDDSDAGSGQGNGYGNDRSRVDDSDEDVDVFSLCGNFYNGDHGIYVRYGPYDHGAHDLHDVLFAEDLNAGVNVLYDHDVSGHAGEAGSDRDPYDAPSGALCRYAGRDPYDVPSGALCRYAGRDPYDALNGAVCPYDDHALCAALFYDCVFPMTHVHEVWVEAVYRQAPPVGPVDVKVGRGGILTKSLALVA